ncbi:MAG: hypothetical protein IPN32_39060 [Deltaproteobacteria bacterium]|nr:hypothetical protein [Deltaproteobacteria bacterium]
MVAASVMLELGLVAVAENGRPAWSLVTMTVPLPEVAVTNGACVLALIAASRPSRTWVCVELEAAKVHATPLIVAT